MAPSKDSIHMHDAHDRTLHARTQDIDKKIKDKEHYRVTKSMPLSEEKKLLREMELLKKQKVAVKAFMAKEEGHQALRKKRNATFESLKGKEAALAEVGAAVRKLQLAQRCGVGLGELVTVLVEVPESSVARVIGKGGANLRKIEEVSTWVGWLASVASPGCCRLVLPYQPPAQTIPTDVQGDGGAGQREEAGRQHGAHLGLRRGLRAGEGEDRGGDAVGAGGGPRLRLPVSSPLNASWADETAVFVGVGSACMAPRQRPPRT